MANLPDLVRRGRKWIGCTTNTTERRAGLWKVWSDGALGIMKRGYTVISAQPTVVI
jgi:hypothetical protein